MNGVLHWLNVEFWNPMWPNLAADVVSLVVAWVAAHRYLLKKWEEQEAAHLKRHKETQKLLAALHVRVGGLESKGKEPGGDLRP